MRAVWTAILVCLSSLAAGILAATAADDKEAALLANTRQLTFEGRRAGEGYFSADGRQMIFQSEREPGNPFYQMYIMDLETGDLRRISPGHGRTTCGWIHPNGRKALFASTQEDPDALGKQKAELELRAQGKQRRYAWSYDEHYDIQETDLDKGGYRNLTSTLGYDAEGAYSPDGRTIVFASNRAAYEEPLDAERKKIFERDKSYFMDIYVMDADGANVRRLTRAPGYDGGPFFSADGKKIVWRRFSEDGARAEVYTMNADGSDKRQITRLGVLSWAPFFHPSGDYIVFAGNPEGFANFELYMVDALGRRDPVRVTHKDGFDGLAAFSPDGKRLAWASKRTADGTTQIFMADWDDAAARRLLGLAEKGAAPAPAAAEGPAMDRTDAAIRADDLRLHVSVLASREMEGRLTGTPGEARAAAYVADAFEALGLTPLGQDGYVQPFPFTAGVSLGKDNVLTLTTAVGARSLRLETDWRPLAFSRTGETSAAAIAFAGYGLVAPAEKSHAAYDSYAGLDVAGKWVLVFRGLPQNVSSNRRLHLTRYADLRYKASVARSRGAKGLIVAPAPDLTYKDELVRLSYEAASGTSGLPAVSVNDEIGRALLAPAGKDLKALFAKLDKGAAPKGFIIPAATLSARLDLVFERRHGRNVLGLLRTGAPDGAPLLIIGAHLDHLGRGETSGSLARGEERGQIHFGADDNASGVAALIEIAQYLTEQQRADKLGARRDILFAAWSGEELGLLGSSHFVKAMLKRAGKKSLKGVVSAYLNMDMVGRLDRELNLFGVGSSSVWKREVERRNAPVGLPIATSNDSYLPTDATSFYLQGVPILHAFTGTHTDYSTPRDTADKVNYPGLEKVARLMALITRSQARSPEPPDYVRLKRPKDSGARRRSTVYLGTIPDYASEGKTGIPISGVMKGGPAEKAGLRGGDVIVGLAGADIENIYDYVRVINGLKVGAATPVVVERAGKRVTLSITPAPRE